MLINNKLSWLNVKCGGIEYQAPLLEDLMIKFPNEKLVHLEVGSAFGGAVEFVAKLWKGRGVAYGYDTFDGYPTDLADDPDSSEAHAMDVWYKLEAFGKRRLTYKYQRRILDKEGLDNAILVKGRINEHSFDDIEKAHMVMLDLDLIKPTRIAYEALKDKVVRGGYMLFHDALPPEHLPLINKFVFNEVLKDKRWMVLTQVGWLVVCERI